MEKLTKSLAAITATAIIIVGATVIGISTAFPDKFYVAEGENLKIEKPFKLNATKCPHDAKTAQCYDNVNNYDVKLTLPMGAVVKTVNINVVKRDMVIPSGMPFGIKMFTKGVIVVGMSNIESDGKTVNPAKEAGIKTGDVILKINNEKIKLNEQLGEIIEKTNGKPAVVTLSSNGNIRNVTLKPAKSENGSYKAGIWVRDSSAGIGTVTYYNPTTKVFGGLGHAVCDIDTGSVLPIDHGEAVGVMITGITKGTGGNPGELRGMFSNGQNFGNLKINNETGIFGYCDNFKTDFSPIEMATKCEVNEGPAYILTTTEGNYPKAYAINIDKVSLNTKNATKNMVIRITDKKLLAKTGGIVQGMSGSPIIQNNRLVGAVTHVFVNDPSRGYGIFAENMENSIDLAA